MSAQLTYKEAAMSEASTKPKCKLIGEDGNVFNLMGKASAALKKAGMRQEASEMTNKVMNCGSYDEALCIISNYVDIT